MFQGNIKYLKRLQSLETLSGTNGGLSDTLLKKFLLSAEKKMSC